MERKDGRKEKRRSTPVLLGLKILEISNPISHSRLVSPFLMCGDLGEQGFRKAVLVQEVFEEIEKQLMRAKIMLLHLVHAT